MKIAILGAGAMGMLFGAYLSRENNVILLEKDQERVRQISECGIRIREKDGEVHFNVRAADISECDSVGKVELIIVFVKAMFENDALEAARCLIDENTYIMTLQNGEGHEEILRKFVPEDRIIIGTTQDNSSVIENGYINHGGAGHTYVGAVAGFSDMPRKIAETFSRCGFATETSESIKRLIWNKLFLNASASALTAMFQTNLGFIAEDKYAWSLAEKLISEAVATANADGQSFDEAAVKSETKCHLERSKGGYTSIYADIRAGRRSEVDTISGAVVKAAHRLGVPVPNMEFVVSAIHAMEDKNTNRELYE